MLALPLGGQRREPGESQDDGAGDQKDPSDLERALYWPSQVERHRCDHDSGVWSGRFGRAFRRNKPNRGV